MEQLEGPSGINISDVLDVLEKNIKEDGNAGMEMDRQKGPPIGISVNPYIKIVEQPASKALRFRYECEGRSAGSIPGVNSSPENKTYPTIKIEGYKGEAVVIVSCVTKDLPYRPHPHNLVGRDGCSKGICCVKVNNDSMTQSFDHLGIQCVKRKDIEEALTARDKLRVDPFQTGFTHKSQPGSIDLNSVRLCFQAFLKTESKKLWPLPAVVSDVIYDKKALCDLAICKLSHCSASVAGGLEMILLCEKVAKEDISIRFFEEQQGRTVWEGKADFTPTQVHKQVAITFKTPKYKTIQVDSPVKVFIQLKRTSDGELSEPHPFQFTPLESGVVSEEITRTAHGKRRKKDPEVDRRIATPGVNPPTKNVKIEPLESSPGHYPQYRLPPYCASPQEYSMPGPSYTHEQQYGHYHPDNYQPAGPFLPDPRHSPSSNLYQGAIGCPSSPDSPVPQMTILTTMVPTPERVSPYPQPTYGGLEPILNGEGMNLQYPIEPMEPLTLNSRELPVYDQTDVNLSQSMSDSLILSCDAKRLMNQENMTDSLTNIANSTYEQMVGAENTNK